MCVFDSSLFRSHKTKPSNLLQLRQPTQEMRNNSQVEPGDLPLVIAAVELFFGSPGGVLGEVQLVFFFVFGFPSFPSNLAQKDL